MTEYALRRKKLMELIGPSGILVLPAMQAVRRNGDYDYPFRQNSDFFYLSGFEEPESVLILAPKNPEGEFILFNRPHHREEEIWTGHREGQEGARKNIGADHAYPIEDLPLKLSGLLEGRETIHYTLGIDVTFDAVLLQAVNRLRNKIRSGICSPLTIVDVTLTVHEMRLIKSPHEINLMKKAAEISAEAHIHAMARCKPGINEYELEADLLYEFSRHGARYPAYTPIVGSGRNSCILHYTNNNRVIEENSIVLIDAGAEYQNYAADITRTFPANGRFSAEQKAIYDIVLAAQLAGIQTIQPGNSWALAQDVIVEVITQGLLDLGILKGPLDDLIKNQAYFPFYMHKSGHWLGLDVHDVGRYKVQGEWRSLEPGMVLTVEPGIYISDDIPNVDPKWHHIGIRIEDDVCVTANGHHVLSEKAPKLPSDIESIMKT